jgi:peptidoglycan DL-endopeptidase CwlO
MVRRIARTIERRGWRRLLPGGVAVFAALGTLIGVLVTVQSSPSASDIAQSQFGLPAGQPSNGAVISGVPLTLAVGAQPLPDSAVPAVYAASGSAQPPTVAPLRRTVQADLLVVAPSSLPGGLLGEVTHVPGVVAAEQIEAVRMPINGTETAVIGADPSQFRSFAAAPTGASDALWQGVADGGIAVSYEMGKLDKIPLGGTVRAVGQTAQRLPVVAFGTLGIGGVDAVVSDATARALGAPAGNAIVVSVTTSDFNADSAAIRQLLPKGAGIEPLVSLVSSGGSSGATSEVSSGAAGAGAVSSPTVAGPAIDVMLKAAESRVGMPYVYGAAGPTSFDCSGLVQWSFAQAGIEMPRVAADQARSGPAVPVSQLEAGDLLFYHTDPTAPEYISHVAIYLGHGLMIQAPQPGMDVEIVPADFGAEFAGAIRVSPTQATAVASGLA